MDVLLASQNSDWQRGPTGHTQHAKNNAIGGQNPKGEHCNGKRIRSTYLGTQLRIQPPLVEGYDVPHDSVIAEPGIPNGTRHQRQVHWEFVVPSAQAYPELLVWFRCS